MQVFYPLSTRVADFLNSDEQSTSGWMTLGSVSCIALFALALSTLPKLEGGTAKIQHEKYEHSSNVLFQPAKDTNLKRAQYCHHATHSKVSLGSQDYIAAHRCAQNNACLNLVNEAHLLVVPVKSKANDDRFL